MSKFLIYALTDPENYYTFYVGRSSNGLRRPKHHLFPSVYNKKSYPLYKKIKELIDKNVMPAIEILEECDSEKELNSTERYYIKQLKDEGFNLLNLTEGGSGTCGRKVSDELKRYLSNLYKGQKLSKEQIEKIRKAKLGKKLSLEHATKLKINSKKRKEVICLTTGEEFLSIRDAAKKYNCDHRGIARTCKGLYKQYLGLKWNYK